MYRSYPDLRERESLSILVEGRFTNVIDVPSFLTWNCVGFIQIHFNVTKYLIYRAREHQRQPVTVLTRIS